MAKTIKMIDKVSQRTNPSRIDWYWRSSAVHLKQGIILDNLFDHRRSKTDIIQHGVIVGRGTFMLYLNTHAVEVPV